MKQVELTPEEIELIVKDTKVGNSRRHENIIRHGYAFTKDREKAIEEVHTVEGLLEKLK